jgi:predicted SnoaL-like aldol condensation-catalyzing enzyme
VPPADPHTIARTVVERCWSEPAGVERMRALLADGYVHHSPFGDWTFAQFVAGLEWVESQISGRTYRVEHVVCEGDLVAAYFEWDGTRVADGSAVEGRGAYHFRLAGGLIGEDWDVFFPAG